MVCEELFALKNIALKKKKYHMHKSGELWVGNMHFSQLFPSHKLKEIRLKCDWGCFYFSGITG